MVTDMELWPKAVVYTVVSIPSASLGLNYVNEEDYGDCDDNDASIHPGFYESPPVVDDLGCDCATQTMECIYDLSQDNDADGVDDLGCDSSTLTMMYPRSDLFGMHSGRRW